MPKTKKKERDHKFTPKVPGAAVELRRVITIDGSSVMHMGTFCAEGKTSDGTEFYVSHILGGGLSITIGSDKDEATKANGGNTYVLDLHEFCAAALEAHEEAPHDPA